MRYLVTFVIAILLQPVFLSAAESVETTGRWDGVVRDDSLRKAAPDSGVIGDSTAWRTLWEKWRPDQEVPQVDFGKDIVVTGVVPGPNRVLLRPTLDEGGELRFVVGGTRMAGPGFGYAFVKVSREGVKSVNGKPIGKLIEAKGKLSTGIMAIGGETTGTILATDEGTWELDLGGDEELRKLTETFDGKLVVVRGVPEWREGVEIRQRRIIQVESLVSAEEGSDEEAALIGTVVIPATLASFDGRTLEVKVWQYDPLLADVSADLFDELIIRDHAHEAGKATRTRFQLGKPDAVREDRAYYLTVFITQNNRRTHMGEKDGKRGLCKVLNRGNPSNVEMIVREVGR